MAYGPNTGWGGMGEWPCFLRQVQGHRQRRPYDVDTTYAMNEYKTLFGPARCDSWSWSPMTTSDFTAANNQARKELVGKLGDTSSFGATATAEGKKTLSTVVSVVTRLALAARHVRRLELFKASEVLGLALVEKDVKKVRYRYEYVSRKNGLGRVRVRTRVVTNQVHVDWGSGRSHVKSLASGWLLWSYGAKPLIQDIQNGMKVLTRELPATLVEARGRGEWKRRVDGSGQYRLMKAESRVKFKCYVRVKNPNLWLANQMGVINPILWVNEAIPFSFVIDWFSNLSDVLGQCTDFAGVEIIRPMRLCKSTITEEFYPSDGYQLPYGKQTVRFTRDMTIPPVKLLFAYERFEWQRGLNAISLLIGMLPKK